MKCYNCKKGVMYGHNVSHSKRRTRKIFKPNLHEVRIWVGTNRKKVRLCTKCLRTYKKLEILKRPVSEEKSSEELQLVSSASL